MKKRIYLFGLLGVVLCACNSGSTERSEENADTEMHSEAEGEIEVSKAQMDAVGIKLGSLEQREMADAIELTGTLEVTPGGEAVVSSKLPGTVTEIRVIVGDHVRAGGVIAYVESPEVLMLREEWLTSQQTEEMARKDLARQEELASRGAGVRKNLENARSVLSLAEIKTRSAAQKLKSYGLSPDDMGNTIAVRSEISGTVVAVDAVIGTYADMQVPIARIVDNKALFASLQLLEKEMERVKPGMPVELHLTNNPHIMVSGTVEKVAPTLDSRNRTVPVRIKLDEASREVEELLIPGTAVNAAVMTAGHKTAVLPEGAVVSAGGRNYIFVLEDEHEEDSQTVYHFRKMEVGCGLRSLGYVEIIPVEQLPENARIVIAGAFYLNSMAAEHGEHQH